MAARRYGSKAGIVAAIAALLVDRYLYEHEAIFFLGVGLLVAALLLPAQEAGAAGRS